MAGRKPKAVFDSYDTKNITTLIETEWESKAKECLIRWRNDIYAFAVEAMGFKRQGSIRLHVDDVIISNQQVQFFEKVNKISYVKRCLQASHFPEQWIREESKKSGIMTRAAKGTGKDFELSILCLWLLTCFDPIKIICVAPTGSQLKTILWSEIKKWLAFPGCRIAEWFDVIDDYIYFKDPATGVRVPTRQMFGRTAMVNADGESTTLSGQHEKHMVLIFDECSRIADGVFDPLDNTCCDPYNWIVGMFNPERLTGFAHEADCGKMKKFYYQLHQSFLDTDRLSPEQKEQHIEKMKVKYGGENSNGFKVYVKGEYPTAEGDGFIPWDYALMAMQREPYWVEEDHPVRAGIDPGLLKDKTIVSLMQGPNQIGIEEVTETHHNNDELQLCEYIINEILVPYNVVVVTVELDGIGHAVFTILRKMCTRKGITVRGVMVRDNARVKAKYFSRKDELWDYLRELLVQGLIKLQEDDDQHAELVAMRKDEAEDRKGRLKLISNRKIEKKIGRSPDKASALVMAIATDDRAFIKRSAFWDKYGISDEAGHRGSDDNRGRTYMSA